MSALSFATERVSPETRAFMLPVATPPKATVFGTRNADFLKAGLVINIVAVVLGVLIIYGMGSTVFAVQAPFPCVRFIPARGLTPPESSTQPSYPT